MVSDARLFINDVEGSGHDIFKALCQNFPEWTEGNHETLSPSN